MDHFILKFINPLQEYWFNKYGHGHKFRGLRADKDDALQLATIQCVKVFDLYEPSRGKAMNFFLKVIQRCVEAYAKKKASHDERFVTESDLTSDTDD